MPVRVRTSTEETTEDGEPDYAYESAWRPEMQYSMLSLLNDPRLEGEDADGETIEIGGEAMLEQLQDTEVLRLIYGLGQDEAMLPRVGRPREVVLAVADGDNDLFQVTLTLGADGSLELSDEQLQALQNLDSADLLTLRLFQADDPANVLWESRMPGFRGWFELPHVSRDLRPETVAYDELVEGASDDDSLPLFRVLGGVRIRLAYISYDHRARPLVTWTDDKPEGAPAKHAGLSEGVFYTGFAHGASSVDANGGTNDGNSNRWNGDEIHWEAGDWTLEPETFWGQVEIDYRDDEENPEPKSFAIQRRLLKPVAEDDGGPMKGADVAMLEEMLWQLGLSAQWGYPGSSGTRIDLIDKKTCEDELKRPRDEFSVGFEARGPQQSRIERDENGDPVTDEDGNPVREAYPRCLRAEASIEAMVRRFQARHSARHNQLIGPLILGNQNGQVDAIVGPTTLGWLESTWDEYWRAHDEYEQKPVINIGSERNISVEELDGWKQATVDIWDNGYPITNNGGVNLVPASYTASRHQRVLSRAGVTDTVGMGRKSLLAAWALGEASFHWGAGDPKTDYRAFEGNADEQGSVSFSQLITHYRYSESGCTVHQQAGLNLFNPEENMMSFALHTAGRQDDAVARVCNGYFWKGFSDNSMRYERSIPSDGESYQSGDLYGYRHGNGPIQRLVPTNECESGDEQETPCHAQSAGENQVYAVEDDYEVLAKAIALYNGAGFIADKSWEYTLRNNDYTRLFSGGNIEDDKCYSCGYSINARNRHFDLPYRQYIWYGGKYDDSHEEHPGEDWCFAYGEREWRGGNSFTEVRDAAIGNAETDPEGRRGCYSGELVEDD